MTLVTLKRTCPLKSLLSLAPTFPLWWRLLSVSHSSSSRTHQKAVACKSPLSPFNRKWRLLKKCATDSRFTSFPFSARQRNELLSNLVVPLITTDCSNATLASYLSDIHSRVMQMLLHHKLPKISRRFTRSCN